ncbi:MAG: hypothetical protein AAB867_02980, partial [Patescibacteria group bacterium]
MRLGDREEGIVTENDYGYEYSRFFSYFTPEELRNNLEGLGMNICYESVTSSGKRSWLQIIGRA